jgi:hypothetical protein
MTAALEFDKYNVLRVTQVWVDGKTSFLARLEFRCGPLSDTEVAAEGETPAQAVRNAAKGAEALCPGVSFRLLAERVTQLATGPAGFFL